MSDSTPSGSSDRNVNPRLVIAGLLALLVLIFIFENTKKVDIRFIIPEVESPIWVALLVAAAVGFIAGWLVGRLQGRDR